jgi:hypothetical protein
MLGVVNETVQPVPNDFGVVHGVAVSQPGTRISAAEEQRLIVWHVLVPCAMPPGAGLDRSWWM